jgi:hypothetical protein
MNCATETFLEDSTGILQLLVHGFGDLHILPYTDDMEMLLDIRDYFLVGPWRMSKPAGSCHVPCLRNTLT